MILQAESHRSLGAGVGARVVVRGGGRVYISSLLTHAHTPAVLQFPSPLLGVPVLSRCPALLPPPLLPLSFSLSFSLSLSPFLLLSFSLSLAHLGRISWAIDMHDGPAALWRHAKCASGIFYSQIMRVNHKSTASTTRLHLVWQGRSRPGRPVPGGGGVTLA